MTQVYMKVYVYILYSIPPTADYPWQMLQMDHISSYWQMHQQQFSTTIRQTEWESNILTYFHRNADDACNGQSSERNTEQYAYSRTSIEKKKEENILLPNHLTTRKKASQTPKNTHEKRPRSVNSHEKSNKMDVDKNPNLLTFKTINILGKFYKNSKILTPSPEVESGMGAEAPLQSKYSHAVTVFTLRGRP